MPNNKPKFYKVSNFTVDIVPIPWARVNLVPIQDGMGNLRGVRPTTPKKQRQGRKDFLKLILRHKPKRFFDGALGLEISAFLPIPKSWPKYKKSEAVRTIIRPTSTPDFDNYLKFISDALQGHFFENDAAIVGAGVSLFYSDRPRWEIALFEWRV